MRIEFLYPEVCALFGERGTILYLKQVFPTAEFIMTKLNDEPTFVQTPVDLVYLGPMAESTQKKIISKLLPYQATLKDQIAAGQNFLFIGNALDILGHSIAYTAHESVKGLGLLDFTTELDFLKRFNCMMLADYHEIKLVGHKTQFGMTYGDNYKNYFAKVEKGIGLNTQSKLEGYAVNNLIATAIVGPLLLMNPIFMKQYLSRFSATEIVLPFEASLLKAYHRQLAEYDKVAKSGL